jgi:hypothetical protein
MKVFDFFTHLPISAKGYRLVSVFIRAPDFIVSLKNFTNKICRYSVHKK